MYTNSELDPEAIDPWLPNVALLGKMGSGKTSVADYLVDAYGYTRVSFAHLLKLIAVEIWGPDAAVDRTKLQPLGVAVREIDPDAWVNALLNPLDEAPGPFVVDDCRFPNELAAVQGRGWAVARVVANEAARIDRLMLTGKLTDREQLQHESETALDKAVVQKIENNGDREDLEAAVDEWLNRERRRLA